VIVIKGDVNYVYGDYGWYELPTDGNDIITTVGKHTGSVYGGGGADVITITGESDGETKIYGGSGNDYCYGGHETYMYDCEGDFYFYYYYDSYYYLPPP